MLEMLTGGGLVMVGVILGAAVSGMHDRKSGADG